MSEYNVLTPSIQTHAGSLSGGNVAEGRAGAGALLRSQGGGIQQADVRPGCEDDHGREDPIRELADTGKAGALVISTDLEELLVLCDRVAVLSRGRLMGVVENRRGAEQEIGALMIGGGHDE